MLGRNPNPVKVLYLRIVMSNGKMGSYIHGIAKRKELLEKECMLFKNDTTIYDFKT
jgi:O6-methylguanine-DNA--protein-cysteine methyltransferase